MPSYLIDAMGMPSAELLAGNLSVQHQAVGMPSDELLAGDVSVQHEAVGMPHSRHALLACHAYMTIQPQKVGPRCTEKLRMPWSEAGAS